MVVANIHRIFGFGYPCMVFGIVHIIRSIIRHFKQVDRVIDDIRILFQLIIIRPKLIFVMLRLATVFDTYTLLRIMEPFFLSLLVHLFAMNIGKIMVISTSI